MEPLNPGPLPRAMGQFTGRKRPDSGWTQLEFSLATSSVPSRGHGVHSGPASRFPEPCLPGRDGVGWGATATYTPRAWARPSYLKQQRLMATRCKGHLMASAPSPHPFPESFRQTHIPVTVAAQRSFYQTPRAGAVPTRGACIIREQKTDARAGPDSRPPARCKSKCFWARLPKNQDLAVARPPSCLLSGLMRTQLAGEEDQDSVLQQKHSPWYESAGWAPRRSAGPCSQTSQWGEGAAAGLLAQPGCLSIRGYRWQSRACPYLSTPPSQCFAVQRAGVMLPFPWDYFSRGFWLLIIADEEAAFGPSRQQPFGALGWSLYDVLPAQTIIRLLFCFVFKYENSFRLSGKLCHHPLRIGPQAVISHPAPFWFCTQTSLTSSIPHPFDLLSLRL